MTSCRKRESGLLSLGPVLHCKDVSRIYAPCKLLFAYRNLRFEDISLIFLLRQASYKPLSSTHTNAQISCTRHSATSLQAFKLAPGLTYMLRTVPLLVRSTRSRSRLALEPHLSDFAICPMIDRSRTINFYVPITWTPTNNKSAHPATSWVRKTRTYPDFRKRGWMWTSLLWFILLSPMYTW